MKRVLLFLVLSIASVSLFAQKEEYVETSMEGSFNISKKVMLVADENGVAKRPNKNTVTYFNIKQTAIGDKNIIEFWTECNEKRSIIGASTTMG